MIVVTGANGRLGRLVALALAGLGVAGDVTLASREPEKLADLMSLGFRAARADFGDAESLEAAFAGATAVLMISVPGPMSVRIPLHRRCFDAARSAGVGRLVYTSRVNPTDDSLYPFAPIHAFSEAYLKSTGIAATIARNNEYIENIIPAIDAAADSGELILPGVHGKVPHIAVREIAEILARLLTEDGHEGRTYELNGPVAYSRDEIAAMVRRAAGRPVVAGPPTREDFGEIRRAQGRPPFMVEMAKGLFDAIDAGEFAQVYPDARRLLGRPTRSVADHIDAMKDRTR